MPRKGPDILKIEKIEKVLKENPRGLWIREIARRAGLDKSTVSLYIAKYMREKVENIFPAGNKRLTKVVKLKGG